VVYASGAGPESAPSPGVDEKRLVMTTEHRKPDGSIRPVEESDLEEWAWKQLGKKKLEGAWEGDADALYDYL
jgi:hypothetical protein